MVVDETYRVLERLRQLYPLVGVYVTTRERTAAGQVHVKHTCNGDVIVAHGRISVMLFIITLYKTGSKKR